MGEDKGRIDSVFRRRRRLNRRYSIENRNNILKFEHFHKSIKNRLESLFDDLSGKRMPDLGSGELFWTEKILRMGFKLTLVLDFRNWPEDWAESFLFC